MIFLCAQCHYYYHPSSTHLTTIWSRVVWANFPVWFLRHFLALYFSPGKTELGTSSLHWWVEVRPLLKRPLLHIKMRKLAFCQKYSVKRHPPKIVSAEPNTSRFKAVYDHSLIINPSPRDVSGNRSPHDNWCKKSMLPAYDEITWESEYLRWSS